MSDRKPLYRVVVAREGAVVLAREVSRETIVVGRGAECDIQLDSARVSRKHLRLDVRGDALVARDLGSRNGTHLDGRPIDEETIRADTTLNLGHEFEMRVLFGSGGPPSAAPPPLSSGRLADGPADNAPETERVVICPHCWHRFDESETVAVARHQDLMGDPVLGPEAQRRFLPSRFTPEGHALDARGVPCPSLACPRCHLVLPPDLLDRPPLFLSMIGAPGSGKSYLLATMVWELRALLPKKFAYGFTDADSSSNRLVNEYERTLFLCSDDQAWVTLEKTEMHGRMYDEVQLDNMRVSLPRPFMFSLTPQSHHPWIDRDDLDQTLVLYDNAGEHFEPGADSASNPGTQHLVHSRGMFFLFDPTKDTRFRAKCHSDDPQLKRGARVERQEILLKEAFDRIRLHSAAPRGKKYGNPLIVVVTKFDIWRDLLEISVETPLKESEAGPVAVLDSDVVMSVSFAVRRLLLDLCPEMIATAEAQASKVIYVPVSALGHSPSVDPDHQESSMFVVRPADIKPIWATVPLLAMLSLLGLLPATRAKERDGLPVPDDCRLYGDKMAFTVPGTDIRLEAPASYFGRALVCPETGVKFWLPSGDEVPPAVSGGE